MRFWKPERHLDDAGLMRAVAEGRESAFAELLERYQDQVLNYAYRVLGDAGEAADVAQETFLRVFRSAGAFRSSTGLKTYVMKIARHLCLDHERKRRPELMERLPEKSDFDTPLEVLDRKEGLAALENAVRDLPENQRSAIVLRHTEGLSYAQIADILSVSVSAVESLLVRGRKTLRRQLAAYEP